MENKDRVCKCVPFEDFSSNLDGIKGEIPKHFEEYLIKRGECAGQYGKVLYKGKVIPKSAFCVAERRRLISLCKERTKHLTGTERINAIEKCVNEEWDKLEVFKIRKFLFDQDTELDGIVISEEIAMTSPCTRVKGTNIVFTRGVVGALNEEQREKFCPVEVEIERPELIARHKRFKKAVDTCKERTKHLTGGERIKQYIECMAVEAKE